MAVRVKLWEDSFNRANATIGTRYGGYAGTLDVFSNEVRGGGANALHWYAWLGAPPNRQYAKCTVRALTGGSDWIGLSLRGAAPATQDAYWFLALQGTTNNARLYRRDAGVLTLLSQVSVAAWAIGDTLECEADGSALALIRNGTTLTTATDATYASGKGGALISLSGAASVDDAKFDDLEIGELRDAAPDFGSGTRSQLATDPFTGADSADIGAAWDVYTGASNLQRVSNRVRVGVENARCLEGYNATIPPANQYMGVTIPTFAAGGDFVLLWVRGAAPATAQSGYVGLVMPLYSEIRRIDSGTMTAALAGRDTAWVAGDQAFLEVEGQAVKLWRGGVKQCQLIDTTYASGRTGVGINVPTGGVANIEIDDFVMGSIAISEIVQAGPIVIATSALDSLVVPSPVAVVNPVRGTIPYMRRRRRMPWATI